MKNSMLLIICVSIGIIFLMAMGALLYKGKEASVNLNEMFTRELTFEKQGVNLEQAEQFVQTWNCGGYESQEACENKTYYYFTAENTNNYEVEKTVEKMKMDKSALLCTSNADCAKNQRCVTLCRLSEGDLNISEIVCAFDKVDNKFLFAYKNVGVCDEFNV